MTLRCVLGLIALAAPSWARAQELPVVLDAPEGALRVRISRELELLGHRIHDTAPTPDAVGVRVTHVGPPSWRATVTRPARDAVEVAVDATTAEPEAVFALRVTEAVRAVVLRAPTMPAVHRASERVWAVGLGARVTFSFGGVSPHVAPSLRVRWEPRAFVELGAAWPSLGGATAAGVTLSVLSLMLGGGYTIQVSPRGRIELGARVEYLSLGAAANNGGATVNDGVVSAAATAGFRWWPHAHVGLSATLLGGTTTRTVVLALGDRTVAEWGQVLAGLEVVVDGRF